MTDKVLDHLLADRTPFVARLAALVACPSVSTDPAYAPGMAEARDWWCARLAALGLEGVREVAAGGHPAVTARWHGAGPQAPTLLVYGHYDVQPPDPAEAWISPPFQLTPRNGRLYARGVADDKGPSLLAIETLGAFLAVEGRLPCNVTILLEGEEEVGSATLAKILEQDRAWFAADAVLSADGARWRADMPTLTVATRGNTALELSLRSAGKDLHSGRYGGVVANAAQAMARLLATLHDAQGAIAVAGFADGAVSPDAAMRAQLAKIPFDVAAHDASIGAPPSGLSTAAFLERLWLLPTLEVNGMWGGYTGPGGKTVIPHQAFAKLSMRLVPGQDPAAVVAAVSRHLRAHCPPGVALEIRSLREGSRATEVPGDHPLLLAAEAALTQTTGTAPLRVRMGATLPLSDIVQRVLGLHTVMFSFATADEDFHAPDENWRESAIPEGFAAWVALLRQVGGLSRAAFLRPAR
ncbi:MULTISPECIES: M20/M25/M40 family metallo-hydrolase [Roseomonadaceae]|uniref:M20/M25/M40 family metallo-hydrolase n=1 Tax=Falsiroseomonas oleicola TaxID=2801474 RepID=A0ABS6HAX4_9PROT|nr:M20/M25/M40 family metallo-hydrolase [Roseomonas oleicola]MBU8545882.1 M20/M25/M40 family metallo-hydrolase [Roseomonas oleicola]